MALDQVGKMGQNIGYSADNFNCPIWNFNRLCCHSKYQWPGKKSRMYETMCQLPIQRSVFESMHGNSKRTTKLSRRAHALMQDYADDNDVDSFILGRRGDDY